jgi:hypothetical protein
MSPEDELCLLLARGQLSPQARERALGLLAGPLQWPQVLKAARGYSLSPLVYDGLRALGFPAVPDPARRELAKTFQINAIQNELLATELARILRLFRDAGIPVAPLKGVALGESLYGDPALRVCSDIDVLVPSRHAREAFHLAVSHGYQHEFTQPRLVDLVLRYAKHCVLVRKGRLRTYHLELHSALLWGGGLERELLEEIWSAAVPKSFFGVPALALSAEWEFLYLAVHAAQEGMASFKWVADLDRLCRRPTVDWKKANDKAMSLGWEEAVRSSLAVCGSLFETPVDPVFGLTVPPQRSGAPLPALREKLTHDLFNFRLLKTPRRKIRFLAHRLLVPTPAECNLLSLPASLFFLYYALRPLRVAYRTAWWFVKSGMLRLERMLRQVWRGWRIHCL